MSSITKSNPPALVVGTGFGCRIHVPALRAAGFNVAGLVGTDAERTANRAGSVGVERTFTDLEEAIDKTGAVAVTIATPPSTHAALASTAIAHGCHLICEKPMAMNLDEARSMLKAAEEAGVTHLMGNEFRWQADRALAARALADGLIGEPRFLNLSSFLSLVASPDSKMPRWWFDEAAGGGWLGAQGSHLIDMVRMWLGDFESLSAALPIVSDRKDVAEDSYVLRFRMRNGTEGILQQTAGAWDPIASMTRIAGTQGTMTYNPPPVAGLGEGPFRGGKGDLLEGGVRVAAQAWWPGVIEGGQIANDIIQVTDLYTTFARLGGALEYVPRDRIIDGIDQTALLLDGDTHGRRDYVHIYAGPRLAATVKDQYKIHWITSDPSQAASGITSAYDLYNDHREMNPMVTGMLHSKEPFRRMRARHELWMRQYPNMPAATGPAYTGIVNARPETRALGTSPVEFNKLPFDPRDVLTEIENLPFDPGGEPDFGN